MHATYRVVSLKYGVSLLNLADEIIMTLTLRYEKESAIHALQNAPFIG